MFVMQVERNALISKRAVAVLLIVYTFLLQCIQAEYCDTRSEDKNTEVNTGQCIDTNTMALMVYNENDVLPLHRQERKFNFASHDIIIKQDWKGLGVAAVVWDAAEVLACYLESHTEVVHDRSVIELGAGAGLVGMVTALLGGQITITDREEVIEYLRSIVEKNVPEESLDRVSIQPLDWTKDLASFSQTFDVILGADIVYIEEVFEDLLKTLIKLSRKDTLILLSCRIRYDRDTRFLERLKEHFVVEKILYSDKMDVNLYKAIKR
ncbi:protein N-lysine methyltransferase METTL21A-like [Mya arenaria]|uniref:protein N-lysine methyltransferase METTL21A-like n=1 Tax=Mya arenaria TaxID=6604 RepID=UPI0022DF4781|nr:protein N-lysine methyltransferase METTL21A-like [Mya arenaria]